MSRDAWFWTCEYFCSPKQFRRIFIKIKDELHYDTFHSFTAITVLFCIVGLWMVPKRIRYFSPFYDKGWCSLSLCCCLLQDTDKSSKLVSFVFKTNKQTNKRVIWGFIGLVKKVNKRPIFVQGYKCTKKISYKSVEP